MDEVDFGLNGMDWNGGSLFGLLEWIGIDEFGLSLIGLE
jgi:hypothetical protein